MTRSRTSNWNGSRCLYETKGAYGYGNVIWPTETTVDDLNVQLIKPIHKPWLLPLTRELKIPIAKLMLYRLLVFIRMVCLGLFLGWRIRHKNEDAIWLWGISTVCEFWFTFSWLLDQLPKLCPLDRATDLAVLKEKFETATFNNPTGKSDLPGIDVFVSTSNTKKKPSFVIANTILSILAADYPVEKLSCYVSDDGGSLLTFESIAEAVSFANIWVPFCRKHGIEPRNPESYFNLKKYSYKNRVHTDFVNDRRRVKREYHEFKVRINGLHKLIRQRSYSYKLSEKIKTMKQQIGAAGDDPVEPISKATWMANGTHWPGTWINPSSEHTEDDHAGVIQIMLKPPSDEPLFGNNEEDAPLDFTNIDIRLPMLVYVSRQKHPDYHHNEKAGAMNALVRASAIMSNGPFVLNLDYDHCVYNSQALREGMCFMMDRGGDQLCYVQFPQGYRGCYANDNTIFFDVKMRALDGLQGPVCVGTGCLFRRIALYGFDPPPRPKDHHIGCENHSSATTYEETKFGNSSFLIASIPVVELQGRPLADHPAVKFGRQPGILTCAPRELVAEALRVISCWYEDETEWGQRVGWIYGSVIGDAVTGYRMHNRGWKSVYCVTKPDAFRAIAPSNIAERLHEMFRWATGSVEVFFSRNNALLASSRMKILQRVAYLNVGIYPFTSVFLVVYCFLPAISLLRGQFIVPTLNVTFLTYLLLINLTLWMLSILETMWSGITFEEWWRNEQFWMIGGTSAHFGAVLQRFLKLIAGIEISFTPTWNLEDDEDDEFLEDDEFPDTSLMILPITIMMVNLIAIAVGISRTIHSSIPQWSKLLGGVSFSFWVLAHLYPVAKGLVEQIRGRNLIIVFLFSGLLSITLLLSFWALNIPPSGSSSEIRRSFILA